MILTQKYVEENFFVASCYFNDLPKGTKFHTNHLSWKTEIEKITKRDVIHRGKKVRFPKPKSRLVYLLIPKQKYIDFCYQNNYIQNSPPIKELIKLHNDIT
jgi:hypothetical protein